MLIQTSLALVSAKQKNIQDCSVSYTDTYNQPVFHPVIEIYYCIWMLVPWWLSGFAGLASNHRLSYVCMQHPNMTLAVERDVKHQLWRSSVA